MQIKVGIDAIKRGEFADIEEEELEDYLEGLKILGNAGADPVVRFCLAQPVQKHKETLEAHFGKTRRTISVRSMGNASSFQKRRVSAGYETVRRRRDSDAPGGAFGPYELGRSQKVRRADQTKTAVQGRATSPPLSCEISKETG
jgi:hypothetical protein